MFSKIRQMMRRYYNLSQLKEDPDRLFRLSMAIELEAEKGEPYAAYQYAMNQSLYGDENRREWWRGVTLALDSTVNPQGLISAVRTMQKCEEEERWTRLLSKKKAGHRRQIIGCTYDGKSIFNQLIMAADNKDIEYIDKRMLGGRFWIVGGQELTGFIKECKKYGAEFIHAKKGGNATSHREGWWTTSMA